MGSPGYDKEVIHFVNGSNVYTLSGTQLSFTALTFTNGTAVLGAYFQITGDDLMLFTKQFDLVSGPWTPLALPVS